VDDENDDVALDVSCSQSQSQLLVVLNEDEVAVSSDGVDSRLVVLSSQNQSLVVADVLEVSCSQSQSQLLVVLNEDEEAVSSDGVDSRLAVLSSQYQSLVVIELELEEGVLEAVSAAIEEQTV